MDRPALLAYNTFWQVVDWVFPPECVGCGRLGEVLCADCFKSLPLITTGICPACGYPRGNSKTCRGCDPLRPHFTQLRSAAVYDGAVAKAITRLKYKSDLGIGYAFSSILVDLVRRSGWHLDTIIPMPLSAARLKSRGYNQAGILARPLALQLNLPMDDKSIKKIRDTATQVQLGASDRQRNLSGAFLATGRSLTGKHVLLVDDVITTGATINECAAAALAAGAKEVYGVSLGRSVLSNTTT